MEFSLEQYFALMFGLIFTQNFVLSQFLGLCPFFGVSKNRESAIGMGVAVIFVMTMASVVTMLIYKGIFLHPDLQKYHMEQYLDIVSFILVIASLVQFVEIVLKKIAPALYQTLGIFLPLITTNCAVLGVTQMKLTEFADPSYSLAQAVWIQGLLGIFGGIGFTLAIYLMAGVRERLEVAPIPESMKGMPIAFLAGCCMALAFFGFQGFI